MTDKQHDCYKVLAELYYGEHPLMGKVKCHGTGIEYNTSALQGFATYDFSGLTRMVLLAHEKAVRFSIEPSGPGMLKLVMHKRTRSGKMHERHPGLMDVYLDFTERNKG